jgi:sporulation protein YlmC with PRC-barrel domain
MDISINAKVHCSDGPCGQVRRVIIKPTTEEITHLVISNEMIPETEYLVPIGRVTDSSPSLIRLSSSRDELSKMPIFDKEEFVPPFMTTFNGLPYMMWPYYPPMFPNIPLEKDHIPADELVIRRGAQVEAKDGHIGRVDEFLINPENDHITHLVLREGHLWGQKDVTIPVDKIEHYKNNTVTLKLNKKEIEQLPGIPIRRSLAKTDQDAGNKGRERK